MGDRDCNYCLYQTILSEARQKGDTITLSKPLGDGVSDVTVRKNGEWLCWFMYLPNHCKC